MQTAVYSRRAKQEYRNVLGVSTPPILPEFSSLVGQMLVSAAK